MKRLLKEHDQEEVSQQVDESLIDVLKTVTGHDGHDAVPKKQGSKVYFTPGKAISATADESDSNKITELSADGDSESENNSDEMETSDDDDDDDDDDDEHDDDDDDDDV